MSNPVSTTLTKADAGLDPVNNLVYSDRCRQLGQLIRYADDGVSLCRAEAQEREALWAGWGHPELPKTDARADCAAPGDEFQLVTSGQVAASVERHLNAPRPVSLSTPVMQVLTIVACRQPVSQPGIESVRGISSDSAIGTLLQHELISLDAHRLFTTTPAFLEYLWLRDMADLRPLPELEVD